MRSSDWSSDVCSSDLRIVAVAVEALARQTAEVAYPRQRHHHQPVEKLVHPLATQRYLGADAHALAQLEVGDGLLGAGHHRLLAGDRGEVSDRGHNLLRIADRDRKSTRLNSSH